MTDSGQKFRMSLLIEKCDGWRSTCTLYKTLDDSKQYQQDTWKRRGCQALSFYQFTVEADTRHIVIVSVKNSAGLKFTMHECTADESVIDIYSRMFFQNMCEAYGWPKYQRDLDELIKMAYAQCTGEWVDAFEKLCRERMSHENPSVVVEARIMDLHYGRKTKSAVRSR